MTFVAFDNSLGQTMPKQKKLVLREIKPEEYGRVRQIFGCAVPPDVFARAFENMSEEDKRALVKVAQRAWVTQVVRYYVQGHVDMESEADRRTINDHELPSLEVHHLFGCLDTLANAHFMHFNTWLRQSMVRKRFEGQTFDLQGLDQIYNEYLNEHGDNKRLHQLFAALPEPLIDWLVTQVDIYVKSKNPPQLSEVTEEEFQSQGFWTILANSFGAEKVSDRDKIVHHLKTHFYEKRRNPYSHRSETLDIPIAEDITIQPGRRVFRSKPAGEGFTTLGQGDIQQLVIIRDGMDEGTLLRVILYTVVLQKLDIQVTSAHIDKYVYGCSRQCAAYNVLEEVETNTAILESWIAFDPSSQVSYDTYYDQVGIPLLSSKWSEKLVTRLDPVLPFEYERGQFLRGYINDIAILNGNVQKFKEKHPRVHGDQADRRRAIVEFLSTQLSSNPVRHVMQMQHDRLTISHVLRIAENPWYN